MHSQEWYSPISFVYGSSVLQMDLSKFYVSAGGDDHYMEVLIQIYLLMFQSAALFGLLLKLPSLLAIVLPT